jgi:hypothetical protein
MTNDVDLLITPSTPDGVSRMLPTGNDRFRRDIEKTLPIRLGQGKRGRPREHKL